MINLIWAMDEHRLIGNKGELPWYFPEDLQYFKAKTLNKTVVMGRTTFESIMRRNNKPLPKRKNVVLSHFESVHPEVETIHDLQKYFKSHPDEEIFVIGGKQIFEQSIDFADRLYITYIKGVFEGNVYFEEFDLDQFRLIERSDQGLLSFCIYERKS